MVGLSRVAVETVLITDGNEFFGGVIEQFVAQPKQLLSDDRVRKHGVECTEIATAQTSDATKAIKHIYSLFTTVNGPKRVQTFVG